MTTGCPRLLHVQAQVASGRAERVRRYKEKRRRRLFAKRIRYEVRRANAVKRPRFKVVTNSSPHVLSWDALQGRF